MRYLRQLRCYQHGRLYKLRESRKPLEPAYCDRLAAVREPARRVFAKPSRSSTGTPDTRHPSRADSTSAGCSQRARTRGLCGVLKSRATKTELQTPVKRLRIRRVHGRVRDGDSECLQDVCAAVNELPKFVVMLEEDGAPEDGASECEQRVFEVGLKWSRSGSDKCIKDNQQILFKHLQSRDRCAVKATAT
jgi:hypothetical protein